MPSHDNAERKEKTYQTLMRSRRDCDTAAFCPRVRLSFSGRAVRSVRIAEPCRWYFYCHEKTDGSGGGGKVGTRSTIGFRHSLMRMSRFFKVSVGAQGQVLVVIVGGQASRTVIEWCLEQPRHLLQHLDSMTMVAQGIKMAQE